MTTIRVSVFRAVPPFAQGLVRDLRVRWALEEAGLAYLEKVIGPEDQKSEAYRRLQPFGQVPAYEEGDLVLFESGANSAWRKATRSTACWRTAHGRAYARSGSSPMFRSARIPVRRRTERR